MSERRSSRQDKIRAARIGLVVIFVALRASDIFVYFSTESMNIRGNLVVSMLWTTACLIALAKRQAWAKYFLLVFMSYIAVIITLAVSAVGLMGDSYLPSPTAALGSLVVAYAGSAVFLARSENIRKLLSRSKS